LQAVFEQRYAGEAFVDVCLPAACRDSFGAGFNLCRMRTRPQGGRHSSGIIGLDNLVKGAAGQAVQKLNIMFGLPEATALGVLRCYLKV